MQKRDVIIVILLSIFTCGIYQIYWFYVNAQSLNQEEPSDPLMNYIGALFLGLVTCGIYSIFWMYKFYKKLDSVLGEDNCILNFILSLFCSPIVGTAIAQNSINNRYN